MKTSFLLTGESNTIKKLNKQIQQLAGSPRNVLIEGEPGAGKTAVARQIHLSSKDCGKPIVTLNPFLTSDDEIKAILFHDEMKKEQRLPATQVPELIDGSTFYVKDIDDLNFSNQARIARFLEARKGKPRVRVIVTMKDSMRKCYEEGRLTEALFKQLSTFEKLFVPPLRDRLEDIPALAEHFTAEACRELGVNVKALDANTIDFLTRCEWKDNVRGLKAVIDKSVHQSHGEVLTLTDEILDEKVHLDSIIRNIDAKKGFSMDGALGRIEKLLLQRMLKAFGYNQSRVAEALGTTEGNLRYRLKKYSIPTSRMR